eukprot:g13064.t1
MFSRDAEQLLTSFRVALQPKTKHVSIQTDHSDVVETLQMLQLQKDELKNQLALAQQNIRKKELMMSNFKTSVNLKIRDTEEKVKRLKLRNEAVENLFSISKRPSSLHKSPIYYSKESLSNNIDDDNHVMIDTINVNKAQKQIKLLKKKIEQHHVVEETNNHLEKRLLQIAKERGKDKFNIKRLVGERDDARRDLDLAIASKKNIEKSNENFKIVIKQKSLQILTLEATLKELAIENNTLQANFTAQNEACISQQKHYMNIINNLKDDFHKIVKEHLQLRKVMYTIENNYFLISNMILQLKSLINLPTITRFRNEIMQSTENAKRILLHRAKEDLERKYKKNILQVKQFEIMNNDLTFRIKAQEEKIKALQDEKMQEHIKLKLELKQTKSLNDELDSLSLQLQNNSNEMKVKNKMVDSLNIKVRENEIELSQILIRNDLMNKLLVSERENNEKLCSYIDYNLEPKVELFKNEMETIKLENRNLKEDLQKITYNLELKLKDFDTIEKENKRLQLELQQLKQTSLDRIDRIFNETNDEIDF